MKPTFYSLIFLIGIATVHAGTNQWTSVGPEGGSIVAVDIAEAPSNSAKYLIGTNGSGAFFSQELGSGWTPSRDGSSGVRVWDLTFSPEYSTDSTIFLATESGGLQRSTDGGATWLPILDETLTQSVQVRDIKFARGAGGMLGFAGARSGGVFKTTDGGIGWQEISEGILIPLIEAVGLSPDFVSDQTLFVGTIGAGVYRSTDSGATWQETNTGMGLTIVHSLAVWPGTAANRFLLAGTETGLFQSEDNGATWILRPLGSGTPIVRCLSRKGESFPGGAVFAGLEDEGMYRSSDWGTSWSMVPGTENLSVLAIDLEEPSVHIGSGVAGVEGQGILGSSDGGETWQWITNGLSALDINAVQHPDTAGMYEILAVASNTGIHVSTNGGETWSRGLFQCISSTVTDLELSPSIISDGLAFAAIPGCGVFISNDSAASFEPSMSGLTSPDVLEIGLSPDFPANPTVYVLTVGAGFFISFDAGATWTQRNNGIDPQDLVLLSEANIYYNADTLSIMVGSDVGGLYRSDDLGLNWSLVTRVPQSRRIRSIELILTGAGEQVGFLGADGYGVYKSIDGGATWLPSNEGLQSLNISDLQYRDVAGGDPFILAATEDAGIFQSLDLGDSWQELNGGLGTLDTKCLTGTIDLSGSLMFYVGLRGGGVWSYLVESPTVGATKPGNLALQVAADESLAVTFTHSMIPETVEFQIDPAIDFDVSWSAGDTIATIPHDVFQPGPMTYCCQVIAGKDTLGRSLVDFSGSNTWCFTVDEPPTVMIAGYWMSEPDTYAGGPLTLLAYTMDQDLVSLQIGYDGYPLGLHLWDDGTAGDWIADDGLFTYYIPDIGSGAPAGSYGLDLIASDAGGQTAVAWPRLSVAEPNYAAEFRPPVWNRLITVPNSAGAPRIPLGGYWDTALNRNEAEGRLTMLAFVIDPDGASDVQSVEIYYEGMATGVLLRDDGSDGDWSAGDGLYTLSVKVPNPIPPDDYLLELAARDRSGELSAPWPYVTISAHSLVTDFTVNPEFGFSPLTVEFVAAADYGLPPYQFVWDFGDGATSQDPYPTHTFTAPGTYQVLLLTQDSTGGWDSAQHSIVVSLESNLTASILPSAVRGQAPQEITLIGSAEGGVQPYVTYLWEVSNGLVLEGKTITIELAYPGEYTVTLEVTDSAGNYAQANQYLELFDSPEPHGEIEAEPSQGEPPLTVHFEGSVTGGTAPYMFAWDFNDGDDAFIANDGDHEASYTFDEGYHVVQMRVVDSLEAVTTVSTTIAVENRENCSHVLATTCSTEVEEQRAVIFTSELTDVQPGDRVTFALYLTGEVDPCAVFERLFTFTLERITITVKFLDDAYACSFPHGQTGHVAVSFNESACPNSTKLFMVP